MSERPPTLMELVDAHAAAVHGQFMGLPPARGHTNATREAARVQAGELRAEIERRLNELASTLIGAINSLADTAQLPKEGS